MPVTPSYVGLPADGTGKKTDFVELTNENAVVVEREMVSIGDPATASNRAAVDTQGSLQVTTPPIAGVTETTPTIASSVGGTTLFASNANAKYRFFQNNSAVEIFVRFDGTAPTTTNGMKIEPYGSYEMSKGEGNLYTGAIKAIAASSTANAYCIEMT